MNISYVLPLFNAQNSAARCIESLLNQTIPPHEVIVIDDGSTDHTGRILKTFGDKINLIVSTHRKGAAHARNYGNGIATGDVIAVCDADLYYKDRSKAIAEFFEKQPEMDVFYSGLHLRTADDSVGQGYMDAFAWDFNSKCPISHPTVAFRKKCIEQCSYHEESIDTDLYEFFLLDLHRAGFKFGGCQNPLMLKIEGDTKRNAFGAKAGIKQEWYKKYNIEVKL